MFSWKCTGCEVAAPGYIKGENRLEHNITTITTAASQEEMGRGKGG